MPRIFELNQKVGRLEDTDATAIFEPAEFYLGWDGTTISDRTRYSIARAWVV